MNQLKQIFRSINKNRLNTSVITISLALGIASFCLIAIFIHRELNTDGFNTDKYRTFALYSDDPFGSGGKMVHCRYGSGEYMQDNCAEVESFCRLIHQNIKRITVNKNAFFAPPFLLNASSNFFEFFNYKLLSGNNKSLLKTTNDIVISKDLALKYFGEETAIGKAVEITFRNKEQVFFVSGVFEKTTNNTQVVFDMVTLIGQKDSRCYLKLDAPESKAKLEEQFADLKEEIPIIKGETPNQYSLMSMGEAYFSADRRSKFEATRDKTDLWIAFGVAMMIMSIAIFNYLSLIRNSLRDNIKNHTIRRIQGATNRHIVHQFMLETMMVLLVSFAGALILIHLALPFFNELLQTNILPQFFVRVEYLLLYLAVLGLIAGTSYLFTIFHVKTQVNTSDIKGNKQVYNKQIPGFNIIQLTATVILVICSAVIIKQIQFINNKKIGLNKDVTEVKIPPAYNEKTHIFKERLMANPYVDQLASTPASPLLEHFILLLYYEDKGVKKEYYPSGFSGDANFINTLDIKLMEGENFSGNPGADKNKCLINQSLANIFPDQNLIGENLPGDSKKTVIGIVEDFHFSNLKNLVEPGFISFKPDGRHLLVKSVEGREDEVESAIASLWKELIPDYPANFENLNVRYKALHKENKNFIRLIGSCCLISIFLSMMGLFAISVDKCAKRIKEIGIRKVNGAKISEILILLNKDFVKWVIIAFVIACPIAYFAMNKWLENFAYKTDLSWWIFALAGVLALGIALLTVSWQSWRAATRNPVEALRYE